MVRFLYPYRQTLVFVVFFLCVHSTAQASVDLIVDSAQSLKDYHDRGVFFRKKDDEEKDEEASQSESSVLDFIKNMLDDSDAADDQKRNPVFSNADEFQDAFHVIKDNGAKDLRKPFISDEDIQRIIAKNDKEIRGETIDPTRLNGVILIANEKFVYDESVRDLYLNDKELNKAHIQNIGFTRGVLQEKSSRFSDVLTSFLGQKITLDLVEELVTVVKDIVREGDMPFTNVYAPQQDVREGILYVVVKPALVDEIRIARSDYFDSQKMLESIDQKIGDPVNTKELDKNIKALSLHPDRQLSASFATGEFDNATKVNIDIQEQKPWHVFASRSNDGSAGLDKEQYVVGGYHNNLWGMEHRLLYQHTSSADFESLSAHNLKYDMPFDYINNLSFTVAHSETETDILGGSFATEGKFSQFGARYERYVLDSFVPYKGWMLDNSKLSFGLDHKIIEGDILFRLFGGEVDTGVGADVKILNGLFGYAGTLDDPYAGTTDVNLDFVYAPGGIVSKSDRADFATVRADADAQYGYLRANADRTMPILTDKFGDNSPLLNIGFGMQWSGDRLIGSERFVSSAKRGFRGYNSGAFSGDSGFSTYLEFESPRYSLIGTKTFDDDVWFKAFMDAASFYNNDSDDVEEKDNQLVSVGASLHYQLNDYLTSELVAASDVTSQDKDNRQSIVYRLLFSY